jgi:predicted CXXCH cytochrome family protein
MNDDTRYIYKWRTTALIAAAVIVLVIPLYALKEGLVRSRRDSDASQAATFVGREMCIDCHKEAYAAWVGSDHDKAMAVASDSTVLGDFDDAAFADGDVSARFYKKDGKFFVHTQGPGGEPGDFEIAYTFGVTPLQQYLIPFPGGRLQTLTIAWDTEREAWFHLYPGQDIPPDDWLHWTRNAQNWNGMCAECHSTNLIKNYDYQTETFSTTWSEIDVSCEACHGPGSRHVEWAEVPPMARPDRENYDLVIDTGDISSRQQVELCAPCHSRRTELGDYDHTRADLLDNIVPAILEERLYFADGQIEEEVYVYGSFVQSKMFKNDIRCNDCHDVHSLELVEEGNGLCLQCHQADAYDSYDHHFHKREHEGRPSDGHLCVKCHMPERPFMVVDWRADHSLRVPRPDLTQEIGVPNACNQSGCHDDQTVEWSVEHYQKWYGIARKPHYGTIIAAGRARDPDARAPLIELAGNDLYPAIVRATALSLLGAYPGDETTATFNRALSDDEALVRYTAVMNVTSSAPEEHVQLVAPLLFDPVRAVRQQAAVQLAAYPDELFKAYQIKAVGETLAEYEEAMNYSLDFAFAGHNLGNLYSQLGKPEQAEKYYKAAIAIDDLFYPAKANLAILYNAQRRNDEAEQLLQEILDSFPEQYEAAYSLGLLLAEMNRFEKSAEYLELAARGMPGYARVFYNLGLVQQQLGRDAEPALIRAVELEPGNLNFLYALADHYVSRGELHKALYVAEQMVARHPQNQAAHDIRKYIEQQLVAPGR